MPQNAIGCDLAPGWIDTHALPSGATPRIGNTKCELVRCVAALPEDVLVVFEAISGRGGRPIAALAALRNRMLPGGKAPKIIPIAVARQLLVVLNAVIRDNRPFRPGWTALSPRKSSAPVSVPGRGPKWRRRETGPGDRHEDAVV